MPENPDSNYAQEVKDAFNELRESVEQKNDEIERLNNTVASTEDRLEKAQDRLDELETQGRRRDFTSNREEDEVSEERKTWRRWLNGRPVSQEKYNEHLYPGEETKDLSIGSGAGNQSDALAPVEYVEEIIKDAVDISPFRQVARILSTDRKQVEIPKLQGRPSAAFVSEGGTRSNDTTTDFGEDNADMLTIDTHEFYVQIPVTRQMLEDAVFDVEAEVRDLVSTEMARLQGNKFLQGSGTGEPQGLVTWSSFNTTTTADTATDGIGAIVADEVKELPTFLKQTYRQNGQWGVTREALRHVRTLKDANNDYLFQPGLSAEIPDTIVGFPYVEMEDLVSSANAGDSDVPLVFGDYERGYIVVDRLQMEVIRDPFSQKESGKVDLHFRGRVGGQPSLAEATRGIQIG